LPNTPRADRQERGKKNAPDCNSCDQQKAANVFRTHDPPVSARNLRFSTLRADYNTLTAGIVSTYLSNDFSPEVRTHTFPVSSIQPYRAVAAGNQATGTIVEYEA